MQGGDGGNVPHAAKTTFRCSECDGYSYILKEQNCFKKYHTQVQLWSDNQVLVQYKENLKIILTTSLQDVKSGIQELFLLGLKSFIVQKQDSQFVELVDMATLERQQVETRFM
ncbi:hypothetical protein OS493_018183 [Desmophyllum pertusum]|uniref:Uncharacterized protein n=1 Tax=Desmophyllum pertusum TaxID=174260 RepID=A0A9X0CME1_9CNID|nr:hypothetical protein OS493_018183 [Desmophyllum pertusum]